MVQLKVKRLVEAARLPDYHTDGAACFDLHACAPDSLRGNEDVWTDSLGRRNDYSMGYRATTVETGLAFEVPEGHVMLIFSRSGHGFNHDVRLANCVGVIDSDYRGEVKVKLTKDTDHGELTIRHGDRIAQAMLVPIPKVELVEVDELSDTARGAGGFGSTGA